jgi:hypothetical protein
MSTQDDLELRVIDASISDFIDIDSVEISRKFRSSGVSVVVVRYRILDLVTLLICTPLGYMWRYIDLGNTDRTAWFNELLDCAECGGLREEIKASRLRKKSLPNGLLELGDIDSLLHPRNYLNSWYRTLNVPPSIVPMAIQRIREWMIQFGGHAVTAIPDDISAPAIWGIVNTQLASQPDHDLFTSLWGCEKYAFWSGDYSITRRLQDQIELIERTGCDSLHIDPEFLAAVRLPEINRRNFRNVKASEKWLFIAQGIGIGGDVVNLLNLDRMFAGYARLANLLDWPQLYPSAQAILAEESPLLDVLPISRGIFCDPIDELSQFVARQEQKFPVLTLPPLL